MLFKVCFRSQFNSFAEIRQMHQNPDFGESISKTLQIQHRQNIVPTEYKMYMHLY